MPFTLISDCQPTETPEMDRAFRRKLWLSTQTIGLIALTAVLGRLTGLISVRWKTLTCLAGFSLLFFVSWFSSYGFVRYWNCIMMRNHGITEQPMVTDRTTSLILRESISFIERWSGLPLITSFLVLVHFATFKQHFSVSCLHKFFYFLQYYVGLEVLLFLFILNNINNYILILKKQLLLKDAPYS